MGSTNLEYYNERYKGSLSDQQCDVLEQLISLKDNNGCLPDLVHIIYELPDYTVDNMIEDYLAFGRLVNKFDKPLGTLADYQTISVASMYYAGNCILGDSVGMGKTVEVAGLLNILFKESGGSHRYLMLTEKRVASQVRKEMIKFTGEYCHLVSSATVKDLQALSISCPVSDSLDYSIVGTHALITASGFMAWVEMYRKEHKKSPFDTLVVDESSILGGSKTETVKSFKVLRKYFKRIILLNATPFESNLKTFYRQLDLLDKSYMPTLVNFNKEYCVMNYTGMFPKPTNKYKNKEQFKRLIGFRYFASTRRDNGGVMEDCSGGIVVSELSKKQKNLLKLTQLNKMVYDCPSYIDEDIEFNKENVPKLASLIDILDNKCEGEESVLVYVFFREAQERLSEWLTANGYSNKVLNGDTSYADGDKIIEGFKQNEFRILITNVQKGLNFGNCNYCIFYSVETNPSKMVQFEGRMTRSFNIYNKNVWILCSRGTEYKNLITEVRSRAEAMSGVTNVDFSVVLGVLLGGIE